MAWLEVDPQILTALSRRLSDVVAIAEEVSRAPAGLRDLTEAAGRPVVREALDDFLQRWGHGCGNLADDARQLATAVDAAARVYIAVDSGDGDWPDVDR